MDGPTGKWEEPVHERPGVRVREVPLATIAAEGEEVGGLAAAEVDDLHQLAGDDLVRSRVARPDGRPVPAQVDGASSWQRFRYLTLPLLTPTILVVLMFRTVDCLKVFAIIYGTTGGGPLTTTESIQMLAYRIAFKQLNMSLSMTTMVIFSVFAIIVLLVYQRVIPAEERVS